ncbi:hypothetical protein POSPLADRAFT_1134429 [Postia placenta MAD-698-R-SB12]|uniref:Autophagy-related protein 2 n=1 Tax=Postia placenta MAD-698-R-SB12 TaxID=670580 RepID=A0A1X6NA50_9APHY|nr:hypothetical protein POSPLADRAFT_1134429 [Postia placenta MAD-698-R-SB12]OSX65316.1 hypothetical protein POSPLADRAFT_1134429 [Postia placenta MAD-698-R-SB12]
MSWWSSSWLPSLPSIDFSLPTGIQRRFISFALRRTLGRFLRPGQLDIPQIDTQIGSGYVQVRDLELDNDAVNALLHGLPLRLHDGSVGKVTARIPWPNPLTSTIGLSLESLHLTFSLITEPSDAREPIDINLEDSVTSLAESFVNEELASGEEASLRESLHPDPSGSHVEDNIPGGLDPFVSDEDINSFETEPQGVSLFATLIERLLARFAFDATDIKITIVHSQHASITLVVPNIQYGTDAKVEAPAASVGNTAGEVRTVTMSGFHVTTRCLIPSSPAVQTPSAPTHTSQPTPSSQWMTSSQLTASPLDDRSPPSPYSDSSDLDEETQMLMSQSIAVLPPPRPASPTSSVASSMYQSAISGNSASRYEQPVPTILEVISDAPATSAGDQGNTSEVKATAQIPTRLGICTDDIEDETIISHTSEPIVLQLSTPSRHANEEKLRISVRVGVIACALRARHIRSILDIAQIWSSHHPSAASQRSPSTLQQGPSSLFDSLEADLRIRGAVLLLLPASLRERRLADDRARLAEFFSHPVVPPKLPYGFVRVHIDELRMSTASHSSGATSVTVTLSELSVFAFTASTESAIPGGGADVVDLHASPILITDPHLPSQYPSQHIHPSTEPATTHHSSLPTFDVIDWTVLARQSNTAKLSLWRTRAPQYSSRHVSSSVSHTSGHSPPVIPADEGKATVEIDFAPLHAFVDSGLILARYAHNDRSETLAFIDEITESSGAGPETQPHKEESEGGADSEEEDDTPPGTPRAAVAGFDVREFQKEQERERRRLERLRRSKVSIMVKFPMVRVQLRCPPPSSQLPRSGAMIVDVHDIRLSPGGSLDQTRVPSARFAGDNFYSATGYSGGRGVQQTLLSADWSRIVLAYAPVGEGKASGIFSSSNIRDMEAPSRPQLLIMKKASDVPSLVLTLDIPSVYIELTKPILDGLQLWGDDLAQLMADALSDSVILDSDTERMASRDPSLIGSRYFARRAGSQASGTESAVESISSSKLSKSSNETAVKLAVTRVVLRLLLPRQAEGPKAFRPFYVSASDVDVLVELKPEGRDETVVTLGVMDVTVKEVATSGATTILLSRTPVFNLLSTSRVALKLRFTSLIVPETTAKESRLRLTLCGITHNLYPDLEWTADLGRFVKAPPGAFESVVPSERTKVAVTIIDSSLRLLSPSHPGALVAHIGEMDFSTTLVGNSAETSFHLEVPALSIFLVDDLSAVSEHLDSTRKGQSHTTPIGIAYWKGAGYALLADIADLDLKFLQVDGGPLPNTRVTVSRGRLQVHFCADTLTALTGFISDLTTAFRPKREVEQLLPRTRNEPTRLSESSSEGRGLLTSLDEEAFRQLPEVGSAPDMIPDDLPSNLDYLDESFGAAAGLRELDDEFDEFAVNDPASSSSARADQPGVISSYGGETIKMLSPEGLRINYAHFLTITPDSVDGSSSYGDTTLRVRLHDCDVTLFLYDGYDWARTRRIIQDEQKEMRRKLAKIRQLVASGQTPDPSVEETNTLLFNSVYIGLEHNVDELEPSALIAAIDEELNEDQDTASQSSWQSLKPQPQFTNSPGKSPAQSHRTRRKRLSRSRGPSIEFRLLGLDVEVDNYKPDAELVSRTLATVRDVEILDHIKTSTWRKFLTALREDSRGNIRETDSNMVRVELRSVHPVPGHPSEEARLRAKILPLRLHVDQDALDFLKKFFSFRDPYSAPAQSSEPSDEIYFQQAEVFPVDIKLDYKPRRVDYRALRDGKTIELMNFFHFDGAEMTLRHITLTGITGWPRFFDLLNDLWTPDVKATQLVDVISGVSPIRSVVNVGSGVADLVLLPIAQYKKDGRVVRGLQKGATAFVKSTAIEAIKLGAKLATGTQVILEQAENVIGGQFKDSITAEALQASPFAEEAEEPLTDDEDMGDLISRYAEQPMNVQEGMQSAYRSLRRNFNSAAQTILAVPMEVYDREGNEGPVRAVVRAVPIAVLKPMIGASEAVSKTLLGLHNTLDPNARHENEAKYKQR